MPNSFQSVPMKFFNTCGQVRQVKLVTRGYNVIAQFADCETLYCRFDGSLKAFQACENEFTRYYTRTTKLLQLNIS